MISVVYTIMCDHPGCSEREGLGQSCVSGADARREMRGTGWRLGVPSERRDGRRHSARDYCPRHADVANAAPKEQP